MLRTALLPLLIVLLLSPLTGCSAVIWRRASPETLRALEAAEQKAAQAENRQAAPQTREAPLEIEVAQAFFTEDRLSVKVRLRAKTMLDPQQIAVTVSGLDEGEVVEEQSQLVSEVYTAERLPAGTNLMLLFTLKPQKLTEYQVRCDWGETIALRAAARNAETARAAMKPPAQSTTQEPPPASASAAAQEPPAEPLKSPKQDPTQESILDEPEITVVGSEAAALSSGSAAAASTRQRAAQLEELELTELPLECETPPCSVQYVLTAQLRNLGSETLTKAELAIGLYWANSGQVPQVPAAGAPLGANEELISLNALRIPAGERRRIRVRVDRPVPVVPGGSFVPHLRVLRP